MVAAKGAADVNRGTVVMIAQTSLFACASDKHKVSTRKLALAVNPGNMNFAVVQFDHQLS